MIFSVHLLFHGCVGPFKRKREAVRYIKRRLKEDPDWDYDGVAIGYGGADITKHRFLQRSKWGPQVYRGIV